jgi:hypothetical protein
MQYYEMYFKNRFGTTSIDMILCDTMSEAASYLTRHYNNPVGVKASKVIDVFLFDKELEGLKDEQTVTT